MTIKIDSEGALVCPSCGFHCLHHDKVEVFERNEDEKKGLHVFIENGVSSTDTDLSGNPSSRRNGLAIRFWCEGCKARPILSIEQHKGSTYVKFS